VDKPDSVVEQPSIFAAYLDLGGLPVNGPVWPCIGWGLPSRRVTATLVRSCRTISPLPVRRSRGTAAVGGLFLWHFPAGFPGSIARPPRPRMSGLSSKAHLRGCLTCGTQVTAARALREGRQRVRRARARGEGTPGLRPSHGIRTRHFARPSAFG